MNIEELESKMFKALAHPVRIKIIKKLLNQTRCVCELNSDEDLELSQSNLSQHLAILRDANILVQERDGTRINYRIKNKEIINLLNLSNKIILEEVREMVKKLGG